MSSQPYLHTKELSLTCLISSGVPCVRIVSVLRIVPLLTPAISPSFSSVLFGGSSDFCLTDPPASRCFSLTSFSTTGFNRKASSALYLLSFSYLFYYMVLLWYYSQLHLGKIPNPSWNLPFTDFP